MGKKYMIFNCTCNALWICMSTFNWSIKMRQRTYFLDIQVNKEGTKLNKMHAMVFFVLSIFIEKLPK